MEKVPDYFEENFKNIIFARVDFAKLVANTPMAKIWSKGIITTKGYYLNNISDVLRVIVLWRYGGTYLDSDTISVKPVPSDLVYKENWILRSGLDQVTQYAF